MISSKKIKLGSKNYLVIDLSQPLKLDIEVYPGDPKPKRKVFCEIDKTGWHHFIHEIGDHNFQPHADGPNHQNPDMKDQGIEFFGLEYFFNQGILIDLSSTNKVQEFEGIKYLIEVTKADLKPFVKQLSEKGAVIIRTGYDKWLEANKPHTPKNLPYLTKEAAEYLASFKNIKVVGVDTLTVDPVGKHASHQALKDKLIVESMVHLGNIPKENREDFTLQTSPLKIVGATGGPVVAYALIEL